MKVRLVFHCRSSSDLPLAYRLEWSKSYARGQRWKEEVELLKEEMRRTLEFLKWKASCWRSKAPKTDPMTGTSLSPPVREGLTAYAFRQAAIFTSIHDRFLSLWRGVEALDASSDEPAPTPVQLEEAMQGVEGGDIGPE